MPKFLASPLKEFKVPVVSWRPTEERLKAFQTENRVTYTVPERIGIKGRDWYRVAAYNVSDVLLGELLLPSKYCGLWRRLVYGALLQEKMYEGWIKRTKRVEGKKRLKSIQEEEINLRNMAGVKMVQYLLYRRLVVQELMAINFDDHHVPVVHSLIEFGIRDSRDWMFETFEDCQKDDGARYLRLDPTAPQNKKEFGEC
jgi:hypothetical protein